MASAANSMAVTSDMLLPVRSESHGTHRMRSIESEAKHPTEHEATTQAYEPSTENQCQQSCEAFFTVAMLPPVPEKS